MLIKIRSGKGSVKDVKLKTIANYRRNGNCLSYDF